MLKDIGELRKQMPYISKDRRRQLEYADERTSGELNYQITCLIREYWRRTGNYQGINDIIGALEGAKAEFYRRIVVPYEDKKIVENGDVY